MREQLRLLLRTVSVLYGTNNSCQLLGCKGGQQAALRHELEAMPTCLYTERGLLCAVVVIIVIGIIVALSQANAFLLAPRSRATIICEALEEVQPLCAVWSPPGWHMSTMQPRICQGLGLPRCRDRSYTGLGRAHSAGVKPQEASWMARKAG